MLIQFIEQLEVRWPVRLVTAIPTKARFVSGKAWDGNHTRVTRREQPSNPVASSRCRDARTSADDAAERVEVVNSSRWAEFYKYGASAIGALGFLLLFVRYWRIDREAWTLEARDG